MDTVIALGTFDGVHMAHRAIIERAVDIAKKEGMKPLIYTFTDHPLAAFAKKPELLMDNGERLAALSAYAEVVTDDFTREFASTPPEEFIKSLMLRFGMRRCVAGFNYTFGARGAGNTGLLAELGEKLGFRAEIVPGMLYNGAPISSTRIRSAIEDGDVEHAKAMLGRFYSLTGNVVGNRHIGTAIGFPTANIDGWEGRAIPRHGVYATRATLEGRTYMGVTNVGRNPTVKGRAVTVETHLIDFSGDIYGKRLRVEFVRFLRGEIRFEGVDALARQIARDKEDAVCALSRI